MTWEFAKRLKDFGVTVNCLHPGVVDTNIFYKKPNISFQGILGYILKCTFSKVSNNPMCIVLFSIFIGVKNQNSHVQKSPHW